MSNTQQQPGSRRCSTRWHLWNARHLDWNGRGSQQQYFKW